MSANFEALLKPPRTRSYAVMVMMAVVSRGELHGEAKYTGGRDLSQGRDVKPAILQASESTNSKK
ncbi:MAG: hypothetical protein WCA19_13015 [Candidatus Acidiferrales bacterium]